jgi:alpha-ketoglutarate-dependent taurine dioxygenase
MFEDPKPLEFDQDTIVTWDMLDGGTEVPIVRPAVDDIDTVGWARANQDALRTELNRYGAIVFRGFGVDSIHRLRSFAQTFSPELLPYMERRSPRTELGDNIYTSTIHPADQFIHFHNTTSFSHQWPRNLWFACLQPAEWEGRTPVADCRKVLQSLDPSVRSRFEEKGVLYVSNYYDGMGLSWQTTFQTDDPADVERYCAEHHVDFEWVGSSRLRTRSRRHAVIEHPGTGEWSWFNQAHHYHIHSLDPEITAGLLETYREEDLPRNSYYGDGSQIDPADLEHIYECYEKNQTSFLWESGDVMMIDNMLVSHSRTPYRGERLIALAIAEMYAVDQRDDGRAYPQPSSATFVEEGD